ncbi:hypothetical protein AAFC00_000453 [Neodothiora populina]|uniref:Endosomal/vacuolar adapter protein YPT35 n=1 Tax=Neodothiora populina TaxID=2781224 RepID=A0ABR3PD78_9PEZI
MEQTSESETQNGDTKSPRNNGGALPELVATTTGNDAAAESASIESQQQQQGSNVASSLTEVPSLPGTATNTPPFWKGHDRTASSASDVSPLESRPPPIQLEDHSDEDHELGRACWAKQVTIEEYTIVGGGSVTGAGAYVVWICTVETLKGAPFTIRKRYSEFDTLRENLVRAFPHSAASIPELPRKSVISRFRPKFLEQRRAGLSHFLNCILLNPEFSGSPLVKNFVFS